MRLDAACGLVFDMDGTLAQSEHFHRESWVAPLARLGITLDDETYLMHFAGKPGLHIIRDHIGLDGDAAINLYEQVNAAYWDIAEHALEPTTGLIAFLDSVRGLPLAVCTSAQRVSAMRMLDLLGLVDRFRAVVTASDVSHGNPDPEPFLRAAQAIDCDPGSCIAFEDAANGLTSARAAGMFCIGVGAGRERLPELADGWIADFADPALRSLVGHVPGPGESPDKARGRSVKPSTVRTSPSS